jgi:hypothetical protein
MIPRDHIHTSTPPLDAPWCAECSALLDNAIAEEDTEAESLPDLEEDL